MLPAVLQVTAGAIALVWSLWQFNRSHNQRTDQFFEQQKQTRDHFSQEQELSRKHFEDEQKLSREHYDKNAQAADFADVQNRLASTDPSTRAGAALRLGQLAETLAPGRAELYFVDDMSPPHDSLEYPHFRLALQQLCTAINIEKDGDIRDSIVNSLMRLVQFSSSTSENDGEPHPFLYL